MDRLGSYFPFATGHWATIQFRSSIGVDRMPRRMKMQTEHFVMDDAMEGRRGKSLEDHCIYLCAYLQRITWHFFNINYCDTRRCARPIHCNMQCMARRLNRTERYTSPSTCVRLCSTRHRINSDIQHFSTQFFCTIVRRAVAVA